jgi:hypothetical protein
VAVRPGVVMTGMDLLDIDVLGVETHSSTPQKGALASGVLALVAGALGRLDDGTPDR